MESYFCRYEQNIFNYPGTYNCINTIDSCLMNNGIICFQEAGNINKSLSQLGNVIMALVDIAHGKSRHVPYRDSKLSFLLKVRIYHLHFFFSHAIIRMEILKQVSCLSQCFRLPLCLIGYSPTHFQIHS